MGSVVNSEPGVPGSSPSAADIFSWCTHYAVTQTVQIGGIIMMPPILLLLCMTDSRRIKNVEKNKDEKLSICQSCQ